jgi:hypothetical protein
MMAVGCVSKQNFVVYYIVVHLEAYNVWLFLYFNMNSNNDSSGSGNVVFIEQGITFTGIQKPRRWPALLVNLRTCKRMSKISNVRNIISTHGSASGPIWRIFYISRRESKLNFRVVCVEGDIVAHCEALKLRIILY